ncbi:unnamed protein product [Closterium sp. NIES-54]
MAAAKRVLRYLCSTSGLGLVLGGRRPVVLTGHVDASWADDQATQRSSQGFTFSLGSGSVSWRSTRSSSVLGSSCEAEIYAGAMAAQELRWLTYLLTDLGETPRSPPVLYVDNKAMLALWGVCEGHWAAGGGCVEAAVLSSAAPAVRRLQSPVVAGRLWVSCSSAATFAAEPVTPVNRAFCLRLPLSQQLVCVSAASSSTLFFLLNFDREHRLEHRTKHIALRYFLARELQQRGQLRLAYVASEANTADIFTKALPPGDHQRTMLGLVPTWPHLLTS